MSVAEYTSSIMRAPRLRMSLTCAPTSGRRSSSVPDAVNIEQFLREHGFDRPPAAARARQILEERQLTRPGKQAFERSKLARAEAILSHTLVRVCGDACLRIDRGGAGIARESVTVTQQSCEICGGSNNRRAAIQCMRLLRRRGIARIVLVGGTDPQQHEIQALFSGTGIEIRYVDGTKTSHTAKDALANKRWTQLVVIWAPTPLKHAVSNLYTQELMPGVRVISVSRRGIEALCTEITRSYT
jgi:hypothetical protein